MVSFIPVPSFIRVTAKTKLQSSRRVLTIHPSIYETAYSVHLTPSPNSFHSVKSSFEIESSAWSSIRISNTLESYCNNVAAPSVRGRRKYAKAQQPKGGACRPLKYELCVRFSFSLSFASIACINRLSHTHHRRPWTRAARTEIHSKQRNAAWMPYSGQTPIGVERQRLLFLEVWDTQPTFGLNVASGFLMNELSSMRVS